MIKLTQQGSSEQHARGYMLFTDEAEQTGAAFRCEGGKLHTFMAVKPADFRKILQQGTSRLRDVEISFSIDGNAEVVEEWVQMFSGRIYMVREVSTTHDLFGSAARGATITFTRKYGKTTTISLPALDPQTSRQFLENCKLKVMYQP